MTYFVVDDTGHELYATSAVEQATWVMNRIERATRVVTDSGVLIATRINVAGPTVAAWFVRLGRMA